MSSRQLIGCFAAALVGAGAMLASVGATQATMLPAPHYTAPSVQYVDCAIGAHLGPLGACIIGHDDNPPVVVEHRVIDAPDPQAVDGCATKSVTRTDGSGASETQTKTNCWYLPEAIECVRAIESEGFVGYDETACHVPVIAESGVAA